METLVLDAGYVPVGRVHWQRAMTLYFLNKVEIVEEYLDKAIRSVREVLRMPSIVRFLKAKKNKKRAIKFSRNNMYARDHGKCQYCGLRVSLSEFTYDHVVPRARGGKTDWDNCVVCCMPCNQRKGSKTPAEAGMKLLSTPVRPKKLSDEFRVSIQWKQGMPESWRAWLADNKDSLASDSYWNGELEQ